MSEHAYFEELVPLQALDALDGADRVAFEIHVRSCVACRVALADYQRVTSGLVEGGAPDTLKARVQAGLPRRERSGVMTALLAAAALIFGVISFVQ